ncbi:hypothetical protein [Streptomyces sp. NPDC059949]|uniref:hypothetical protein n=1 Tax=Streptomyces sp. NPDC059949 TaxID=3347013 RepID=UPI00364A9A2A
MKNLPYRHLARSGRRIETDTTAAPEMRLPATGRLPDAATLIRRSHEEQLTGAELARAYETSGRTLYAALAEAGHSREDLWAPPKAPRKARRNTSPDWAALQRDYEAGDAPLLLADRYGIRQQVIDRNLKAVDGLHVRTREEAVALRSQQREAADEVRYRMRTGALDTAAAELGLETATLRAVLSACGLLLHDS